MNPAIWAERHGRRRRDEPALADGERIHATWVKELEDLTNLAEELGFDSVWTLDRIVVPEASDRQALQYSFGMIGGFPKA